MLIHCMSKFMAHGTVTFTCYNHKIGVVILHKVNIWQVVEELWHFNFQMACLKHTIWSNCNRHLWHNPCPRGFATHTIYIYKCRLYLKLIFWFFLLCFVVLKVEIEKCFIICIPYLNCLKILEKKDMRV